MAESEVDPRSARTRAAIRDAFRTLALGKRWSEIRIGEAIARAGVGRSTFYEHFHGKDDLLSDGLRGPLAQIADGVVGAGDEEAIAQALAHFWQHRVIGLAMLSGNARRVATRTLAELIEARLARLPRSSLQLGPRQRAQFLSAGLIELLANWMAGRGEGDARTLALRLARLGAAIDEGS